VCSTGNEQSPIDLNTTTSPDEDASFKKSGNLSILVSKLGKQEISAWTPIDWETDEDPKG